MSAILCKGLKQLNYPGLVKFHRKTLVHRALRSLSSINVSNNVGVCRQASCSYLVIAL